MTKLDQLNYLLLFSLGQDLNSSIRKIPSPACKAKPTSHVYDLSPEEDALNHAADDYAGPGVQRKVHSPVESRSSQEPVIELVSCSLQLDRGRWHWGVCQLSNRWSWLRLRRRRLTRDLYKLTNQRLNLQSMNSSEGP